MLDFVVNCNSIPTENFISIQHYENMFETGTFSIENEFLRSRICTFRSLRENRDGARNSPTEGLELPTGVLKWLKNVVSVHYFLPNFLRREPKSSSDGGLDASDGEGCSPPSPPLAPPLRENDVKINQILPPANTVERLLCKPQKVCYWQKYDPLWVWPI